MKNTLVFVFLTILASNLASQSSIDGPSFSAIPYHQYVCFDEEVTEQIRVSQNLNLESLTIFDKLKFKSKTETYHHYEYLNPNGNVEHESSLIDHENIYPEWYTPPIRLKYNSTGVYTYFNNDNEYLPNGWTGGTITNNQHGTYSTDEVSGERYFLEMHSQVSRDAYITENDMSNTIGVLAKYVFYLPSQARLTQLQNEGATVIEEGAKIIVENIDFKKTWDNSNKTISIEEYENNTLVQTRRLSYSYDSNIQVYFIEDEIIEIPQVFDNSQCYDVVININFSNYSISCNGPPIQSKKVLTSKAELTPGISIYPNPVNEWLTILIPEEKFSGRIVISDFSGQMFKLKNVNFKEAKVELNVKDLPAGVYTIDLENGNNSRSNKFIKQ